jgi:hypothetical protein
MPTVAYDDVVKEFIDFVNLQVGVYMNCQDSDGKADCASSQGAISKEGCPR